MTHGDETTGLGETLGTTAVVAGTIWEVHGLVANAAGLCTGLVLAAHAVDLVLYPQRWLGAMVLLEVALTQLETRKSVMA